MKTCKKFLSLFLAAVLCAAMLTACGSDNSGLKKQVSDLEAKQKQLTEDLENSKASSAADIEALEAEISSLEEEIAATEKELKENEKTLQASLENTKESLDNAKELAERLKTAQDELNNELKTKQNELDKKKDELDKLTKGAELFDEYIESVKHKGFYYKSGSEEIVSDGTYIYHKSGSDTTGLEFIAMIDHVNTSYCKVNYDNSSNSGLTWQNCSDTNYEYSKYFNPYYYVTSKFAALIPQEYLSVTSSLDGKNPTATAVYVDSLGTSHKTMYTFDESGEIVSINDTVKRNVISGSYGSSNSAPDPYESIPTYNASNIGSTYSGTSLSEIWADATNNSGGER